MQRKNGGLMEAREGYKKLKGLEGSEEMLGWPAILPGYLWHLALIMICIHCNMQIGGEWMKHVRRLSWLWKIRLWIREIVYVAWF